MTQIAPDFRLASLTPPVQALQAGPGDVGRARGRVKTTCMMATTHQPQRAARAPP